MRNVYMEEDAENIMDGEKDQRLCAHGNWNREGRDTTTNSAKSKAEVLWTCHAIRWFGKGDDVSIWRGKEKTRKTKEKVDGRPILETTGMNLAELRDATTDSRKWKGLIKTVVRV